MDRKKLIDIIHQIDAADDGMPLYTHSEMQKVVNRGGEMPFWIGIILGMVMGFAIACELWSKGIMHN